MNRTSFLHGYRQKMLDFQTVRMILKVVFFAFFLLEFFETINLILGLARIKMDFFLF